MQALGAVTRVVDFQGWLAAVRRKAGCELCGNDHLVAHAALGHPFADPGLAFFGLVAVRGVDEVPTVLEEVIEDFKRRLLVALAHHIFPGISKIHRSKA